MRPCLACSWSRCCCRARCIRGLRIRARAHQRPCRLLHMARRAELMTTRCYRSSPTSPRRGLRTRAPTVTSRKQGNCRPRLIDLGLLTLAPAASVPGLEVERRRCDVATSTGGIGGDGDEWEPIESLLQEDELLLFGGAALAHASSALPALRHRVGLPASGRERVSMPFFLRPSLSVPLPPAGPRPPLRPAEAQDAGRARC